jgi:hypothetical protein
MPAVMMATGAMKTMNVVILLLLSIAMIAGAALLLMAAVAVPMVAAAAVARAQCICRRAVGHICRRRRHTFGLFAGSFGPEVSPMGAATAAPVQGGLEFAGGGARGPLVWGSCRSLLWCPLAAGAASHCKKTLFYHKYMHTYVHLIIFHSIAIHCYIKWTDAIAGMAIGSCNSSLMPVDAQMSLKWKSFADKSFQI